MRGKSDIPTWGASSCRRQYAPFIIHTIDPNVQWRYAPVFVYRCDRNFRVRSTQRTKFSVCSGVKCCSHLCVGNARTYTVVKPARGTLSRYGEKFILFSFTATDPQLIEALRFKPEVAGSIPEGVIRIFHWHNPSGRTIALGPTQPLT